ncbi:pyridoxal phosphate-dependent aminotransferase [Marivita hallyeonensis]|uniref:aspartate transaminase n=1 Tax=Marivita hallyeonensis TaxID=996342 RepID=A0A1M5N7U3_9RHOB|nr:pyridoxal phosphate-dependent aminotransferase [Marivita hallyeonensis]SHG85512.1 Aspartate/methionine/tyrosine aminotransferase [Marivita hallyeonensis]
MSKLDVKFAGLGAENAPGQEVRQNSEDLKSIMRGDVLPGTPVDFSHGDVDAFAPTPGARDAWQDGYDVGGAQAYTEYRGDADIRAQVAGDLAAFTCAPVDPVDELIITPGTQGALFLALGSVVDQGTKVAIMEPDYFANCKLVRFFGGEIVPIPLTYQGSAEENGPDLAALEAAFSKGVEVCVFSTPNNPTGLVFSQHAITRIAELAAAHNVTLIVDQLYSRLLYSGETYTHLRACAVRPDKLVTIMGPSKTESLSGFRLGVAFGSASLIERMEKLQAIVSLRAAGYSQAALRTWFREPDGWMAQRIAQHEAIRDDLLMIFRKAGFPTATTQAGSYVFPELPDLAVPPETFARLLRVQAGVTVTPGSEFAPHTANSIRLNFSQDHEAAVAAAHRIVEMVERYRA